MASRPFLFAHMNLNEEDLQCVIEMQLPCLHVMYAAGNDIEIVVYAGPQDGALGKDFVHDVRVLRVGDVLVAVAAEEIFQRKPLGLAVLTL